MENIPIFVKHLTSSDCASNHLMLPPALCRRYGSRIPRGVKLLVRNGYSLWLDYNKTAQRLEGMHSFFQFLNIIGGETLMFEHCGGFEFKVTVFSMHGAEIQYPNMPNFPHTDNVSMENNHWSFLQHLNWGRKVSDEIVVPFDFLDVNGFFLPPRVYYEVSTGHEIVGSYSERRGRILGLASIRNMLDVKDLNGLSMIIFIFDGVSRFAVKGFAKSYLLTRIGPSLPTNDESSASDRTAFQFVVQGFHMLEYEHEVDIPVEYRRLFKCWLKTDMITVYAGMRCWTLEIRHRRDRKRCTINSGWRTFRTDLNLEEGDVCVFEWMNDTIRNFNVHIIKSNVAT